MSWADIKNRYKSGGTAATQSTEDMAARRILRALGMTEKTLPAAEKAAGLVDWRPADTTLLERAEAMAGSFVPALCKAMPAVRDVRHLCEAEDVAQELLEQGRPCQWLVYRVHGEKNLMAMRGLPALLVDVDDTPLPCQLFRSRDGSCTMQLCDAQVLYNKLVNKEARNG